MNYNQFSSTGLKPIDDPINSRAKLDTGTQCNYECGFCYYLDKLHEVTGLETVKQRAKKLFDFGMKEIDLSGGESSVHRHWFEILDYCRDLGFENISCLSNGHRFARKEFVEKSFNHGLNEILFSLHGWDGESHAKIVGRKGAFERLLRAIDNCQEVGLKVRINCTVTGFNAPHLLEYAQLINRLGPIQVNFLPLNYWEDAQKLNTESYEVLSKWIKRAIDGIHQKIEVNVRYIPFCFMEGYEKYVVGVYQHIFDQRDWNIIAYDVDQLKLSPVTLEDYFKCAGEKRMATYSKGEECFSCSYFHICDGVEHKLKDVQEVSPICGDGKILDVQFFRRGGNIKC